MTKFMEKYQDSIEAIPDAAVLLQRDNEIEYFNKKAQSYLGLKKKKHLGKSLTCVIRDPVIADFLSSDDVFNKIAKGAQILSPYNEDLILSLSILPYPNGARLLIARNITKIHRISKMRRDFVANVSHELRTPLTVIKGYLEMLLERFDNDEELLHPILTMQENSQRMENLVKDLLMLSKLEVRSDKEEDNTLINIPNMISAIIKDVKYLNKKKNHAIKTNIDNSLLLPGNESELQSAFLNLVNNAIRYTPDNGVICVEWYKKNKSIYFSVTDNGEGIAAKHLNRLTERFYRVDKGRSRSEGGTGLGLAIVKHILNRHNAELIITSKVGKGSTFSCQFLT